MTIKLYMDAAKQIGKPLMIGEASVEEVARDDKPADKLVYEQTPDYIDSLWNPNAPKWVKKICDEIVADRPQLVLWWDYSSDRPQELTAPSWNVKKGITDGALDVIVEADKRLRKELEAP